jgi:hypothetical protein
MMASEQLVVDDDDDEEWPNLISATTAAVSTFHAKPEDHFRQEASEDWEMLQPDSSGSSHTSSSTTTRSPPHNAFEMVGDDDDDDDDAVHVSPVKSHSPPGSGPTFNIRHCASSPNLCSVQLLSAASSVLATSGGTILDAVVEEDYLDDSFSLIAGPASVMTASTTMTISFRDAAATAATAWSTTATSSSVLSTQSDHGPGGSNSNGSGRRKNARLQSKFVVVPATTVRPMRRCSKSTGDLQSLCQDQNWLDGAADDDYGPQPSGVCDTMEFFNRKALGSLARTNGLKLRPDEAKRRDFILLKKEQQRQQSQPALARSSKGNGKSRPK